MENAPFIVFTGGEPALQLDSELIFELKKVNAEIAIETNGTLELPLGIDWICMSPKANTNIVITSGEEIKLSSHRQVLTRKNLRTWNFLIAIFSRWMDPFNNKILRKRSIIVKIIQCGN